MMNEIEKCTECNACLDVCHTYIVTNNMAFSPVMRLKFAGEILNNGKITDEMIESMYNCPECAICDVSCPESISISKIVETAREELVKLGHAPLERQKKIMGGIEKTGNSVRGDPEKRLDWLTEPFEENDSKNLLFLGCLPSYLVKSVAKSSYEALKKASYDFRILKDEGCCGIYFYDAGKMDLAETYFKENINRFKKLGIKRIIVPCVGCYQCFKSYYPKILGKINIEIYHISEILAEEIKKGNLKLESEKIDMVYHDPCRLGRKEGIYEEPREILRAKGINIVELDNNKEKSACCGAGAGIRSLYRDLSEQIAFSYLKNLPSNNLATSCSFCVFNFRQAAKKNDLDIEIKYIAELI